MIQIALSGSIPIGDQGLAQAVQRIADAIIGAKAADADVGAEAGTVDGRGAGDIRIVDGRDSGDIRTVGGRDSGDIRILELPTPFEFVDRIVHTPDEVPVDLAVCCDGQQGMSALEVARDILAEDRQTPIVLVGCPLEQAYEAMQLGVRGFLPAPVDPAAATRALSIFVKEAAALAAQSVPLRFRERIRRIPFDRFVYAETSNHDQVVHLLGGEACDMRSTSVALFEALQVDPRFFKAGSTSILNMDMVQRVRSNNNLVEFVDGSSTVVPVRFRKPLENLLLARGQRAQVQAQGQAQAQAQAQGALA